MKAVALALVLSLTAFAEPDGGLDVELLDAGTVLPAQMVCMPGPDAQRLDLGLRTAESERDQLKTWLLIAPPAALLLGAIAGGLIAAFAKK